ncbi:AIPR family protein [Streptomyces sp. NPDC048389]|uniref:AIPR family protein n=1 Tax=Streptomyces sp. NPDC048389 TaxID=3154622 RepID=UPI0034540F6D
MAELDLNDFARTLIADTQATAEAEQTSIPGTFTRRVLEDLELAGVVSNTFTAYHKAHGVEVYGYGLGEANGSLDLFITDFRLTQWEDKLTKAESEKLFRRLLTFARRCGSIRPNLDEHSDVRDMCEAVEKALADVPRIRLFLLSNRVSTSAAPAPTELGGIPVTHEIWDLSRLHRQATSGMIGEPIVVNFDPPLPCLSAPSSEPNHSVVLAVVPGQRLAELYDEHRTRFLELNVRSFLQTRGTVNRGIKDTLLKAPARFLAYNNGITATASHVDFVESEDGEYVAIREMRGLQIVNGGQTTASLHHVLVGMKGDLSQVRVQMKLTMVRPEHLAEIVPKISRFSNTQNRVSLVDFSSNHEFHVALERITRTLWAPAADGSSQETRWFYERARGQYADELSKATTPAAQRKFKVLCPTRQKFSKSDLAKYVHSWGQLPYFVSRGAQKNFAEFMIRVEESTPTVDLRYCQRVIAMALLFKAVDKAAAEHGAGSHKSLVTTYTMARLSLATDQRIDLDRIWREQDVTPALRAALDELCPRVMRVVVAANKHVGEWAKQSACWDAVSRVRWTVPETLADELLEQPVEMAAQPVGGDEAVDEVESIAVEEWDAIGQWAKETGNLELPERQLAFTVAKRLDTGELIPAAQAVQALHVRREALRLGFRPTSA